MQPFFLLLQSARTLTQKACVNFVKKPIKAIWEKKKDLLVRMKRNVVFTALNAIEKSSRWHLDGCCSHRTTGNAQIFSNLKSFNGGNVTFGHGKTSPII